MQKCTLSAKYSIGPEVILCDFSPECRFMDALFSDMLFTDQSYSVLCCYCNWFRVGGDAAVEKLNSPSSKEFRILLYEPLALLCLLRPAFDPSEISAEICNICSSLAFLFLSLKPQTFNHTSDWYRLICYKLPQLCCQSRGGGQA